LFVCIFFWGGGEGRGGQGENRRIKLKSECVAGLMATNCIAKNIYRARSANRILNRIAHRLFEPDRTCYMLDICSKFQITFYFGLPVNGCFRSIWNEAYFLLGPSASS